MSNRFRLPSSESKDSDPGPCPSYLSSYRAQRDHDTGPQYRSCLPGSISRPPKIYTGTVLIANTCDDAVRLFCTWYHVCLHGAVLTPNTPLQVLINPSRRSDYSPEYLPVLGHAARNRSIFRTTTWLTGTAITPISPSTKPDTHTYPVRPSRYQRVGAHPNRESMAASRLDGQLYKRPGSPNLLNQAKADNGPPSKHTCVGHRHSQYHQCIPRPNSSYPRSRSSEHEMKNPWCGATSGLVCT